MHILQRRKSCDNSA